MRHVLRRTARFAQASARSFARAQDGAGTIFGLFLLLSSVSVAGLALDIANAYRVRTALQVAGDAAAHAALVAREFNNPSVAKATALEVANVHLPRAKYGDALIEDDIVFGHWDAETEKFEPDEYAFDAVMVSTARAQERHNSVGTYLLRFAGVDALNIRGITVFETYRPTCLEEGIVGEEEVVMQSGNYFTSGFCVHSNDHATLSSGNTFEDRTIVSMPDRREIDLPASGMDSNEGLPEALRDGSYFLRIVSRIDAIIAGVQDPDSKYYPDYIESSIPINLDRNDKLDDTIFEEGHIYRIECNNSKQQAAIHTGTVLSKVVIWTNCQIKFGADVVLQDTVFVNENTAVDSFSPASKLQIGKDDDCATGGDAQLVTRGGFSTSAQVALYGGQILAAGDISFQAQADGIEGASIVSGGRVEGSSGATMGFCDGEGMENTFEAEYFRLAF